MVLLGIDPGSRHTGFGVVRQRGSSLNALAEGRISPRGDDVCSRLEQLSRGVEDLLTRWQPEGVAIESLFHGKSSRSLIVLAQARGAILTTLGRFHISPREFTPAEVKNTLTGNGRADKQQVGRMVEILLGLSPSTRPSSDATDALALAICLAHTQSFDRLAARMSADSRSR